MIPTINKRIESLFSLNYLIHFIHIAFELLNEGEDNKIKNDRRYLVLVSFINIQLNSFLDEWDDNFKGEETIKQFKKRIKPVISEIRKFKDVKHARNIMFAHVRDSRNQNASFTLSSNLESLAIPLGIYEIVFVFHALDIIKSELYKEFSEDFKTMDLIKKNKVKKLKNNFLFTSEIDVEKKIKGLKILINKTQ